MSTKVGFRELRPEEWELIAGGWWTDGFGNPEIVATGTRNSYDRDDNSWINQYIYAYGDGNGNDGGSGDDPVNPPEADTDKINADVEFTRPLTAAEAEAVAGLKAAIAQVTAAINGLGDNESITLRDPSTGTVIGTITGAELKELWSKTDFSINESVANGGTNYANGTSAETVYNNGNPQMNVNIDFLVSQNNNFGASGMNDYVLHELGHNVFAFNSGIVVTGSDGLSFGELETLARAVGLAVANDAGIPIIQNGEVPLVFTAPPPPPPPPSGGGGGGNWGGSKK